MGMANKFGRNHIHNMYVLKLHYKFKTPSVMLKVLEKF